MRVTVIKDEYERENELLHEFNIVRQNAILNTNHPLQ